MKDEQLFQPDYKSHKLCQTNALKKFWGYKSMWINNKDLNTHKPALVERQRIQLTIPVPMKNAGYEWFLVW